jgi:hypothetical protein
MKDLKYYETLAKIKLENHIKEELKKNPVIVSVDCTINSEADLQKSYVQFSIRRRWRHDGRVNFEKAKIPELRFIIPKAGSKLFGIPLQQGIILPIFAPEVLDDAEITTQMMREGLILHLKQKFDEYYYKLLMAFDMSDLPGEIVEEIKSWGNDGK